MKIFINPGHDRSCEPGACNRDTGLREADVVAEVGRHMADILIGVGYEVRVVQDDSLTAVCRAANEWPADLFVSVHCNSFGDPAAHGTETLYYPGSRSGRALAIRIQNQLINEFDLTDRGVKERRDLGVLRLTDMPAALAELAFISNADEERLLDSEAYRWAQALARGVTDYVGGGCM